MKRLHVVILLVVLLVLALFALRVHDKVEPGAGRTEPQSGAVAPSVPDAPPAGSVARETPDVGTSSLPRAPGSPERP